MKSIGLLLVFAVVSINAFSKDTTDSLKVLGNCGSCKKRIEKAAKEAGAVAADWNDSTQMLTVNYDDAKTTLLNIEKQIATAGHDTRDVKASDAAYLKLEDCCKYDRSGKGAKKHDDKD